MRTSIIVTHRQIGFHRWPDAPPEVAYLAHPHRHQFLMIVSLEVSNDDRELEFHTVQTWIRSLYNDVHDFRSQSCETIAKRLGEDLAARGMHPMWVECWEDEEHGAHVDMEKA